MLIVKGAKNALIEVYDMQGIRIKSIYKDNYELHIALPKGVYIVQQRLDGVIYKDKIII